VKIARAFALSLLLVAVAAAPAQSGSGKDSEKNRDNSGKSLNNSGQAAATPAATPTRPTVADEPLAAQDNSAGGAETAEDNRADDGAQAGDKPTRDQANAEDQRSDAASEPAADSTGRPAELGPAGAPIAGERVAAGVGSGEVRIRVPGSDEYVTLGAQSTMPVGSVIDARQGTVVLRVALPGGRTDSARFGGGMFTVRQNLRDKITELRLRGGSFKRCNDRTTILAFGSKPKPRVVRRLWGQDRGGRFRTHGHNSIATVRGTRWLTEDRCDGTLTRVTEGAVEVRDRRTGRRVLIRAGQSYLAKKR
jgi:hypothetical protein